ncbi:MAG: NAD(P)/FAD-dependent oxidoreductase [Anaeroplasmataceae bacterium]
MNKYDTIIIGAGPAGISCAIYLKRYNLNPCVVSLEDSALKKAQIENYYGIENISGEELFNNGIKQAKSLGIDVFIDGINSIEFNDGFIASGSKNKYFANSIFLATGKARKKLNVKNFEHLLGSGVSMCATCDGFFFRNKKVGIVGSKKFMESELEVLERFTNDITIFTNGEEYLSNKYKVVSAIITELKGNEKLEAVIAGDKEYPINGLFIAIGDANANDFANHIGMAVDQNLNVIVDEDFMTNIPGIFAGGDAIGGLLQVSKSVGDGANAALGIKKYLKNKKL